MYYPFSLHLILRTVHFVDVRSQMLYGTFSMSMEVTIRNEEHKVERTLHLATGAAIKDAFIS